MPIPAFDSQGVLPVGNLFGEHDSLFVYRGHDATLAEVEDRFVTHYPQSATRAKLFSELEQLVTVAQTHFSQFNVGVSGTFVSNDVDPTELFMFIEVLGAQVDQLSGHSTWLVFRLFDDCEWTLTAGEEVSVTTALVRSYPEDHSDYLLYSAERMLQFYMASYFDSARGPSGYLEVFMFPEGVNDTVEERPAS